eukprot:319674-Pelagomonas_calceolata.AAC.2
MLCGGQARCECIEHNQQALLLKCCKDCLGAAAGAPKQASGFVFVSDACCQTSTQDVGLQVHAHSIPSHQESYFPSQQVGVTSEWPMHGNR